ncbi:hypothetical protein QNH20_23975 [Neobacillus sp. WH10]|uniref:hypothetical protein n=1 Tax=Neobacillus sp. WH10 TaxID=3047873 RepID=UPI0024C0F053|nr:hypothetical protein [Neobacillus sp. WH10]WHY77105.1 hypothetical protein QNH20_23975 [Neobacillus sp. WH10]
MWKTRVRYVRKKGDGEFIDFSMKVKPFESEVSSWISICFSNTFRLFYLPIIAIIIISMVFSGKH